jgi:hypothetical protein
VALVPDGDRVAAAGSAARERNQHEAEAEGPMEGRAEDDRGESVETGSGAIDGQGNPNVTSATLRR